MFEIKRQITGNSPLVDIIAGNRKMIKIFFTTRVRAGADFH